MRNLLWATIAGGVALAGLGVVLASRGGFVRRGRVLLIGDSLAVGLTKPLQRLGLNLEAHAVVGTTLEYWLTTGQQTLRSALKSHPGLVLVSLGTAESYQTRKDFDVLSEHAHQLLTQLQGNGAAVAWIGPPPLPEQYAGAPKDQVSLDVIANAVEATTGAEWIDSSTLTLPRVADGLHLTDPGYVTWAEILVRELVDSAPESHLDSLGDDPPEVIPPPPSIVTLPHGWKRLKFGDMPPTMSAWAINVLAERRPLGDIRTRSIDGRDFGILTEWHWDDHVGRVWKWHRGVSAVEKASG